MIDTRALWEEYIPHVDGCACSECAPCAVIALLCNEVDRLRRVIALWLDEE